MSISRRAQAVCTWTQSISAARARRQRGRAASSAANADRPRGPMPVVWRSEFARGQVLRRMRDRLTAQAAAAACRRNARSRAAARHGAVRRSRGLHRCVREPRRGGDTGAPRAAISIGSSSSAALWRSSSATRSWRFGERRRRRRTTRSVQCGPRSTSLPPSRRSETGRSAKAAGAGWVLTGEAAVTIGAEGQGMVAGDLVNTASRIQSIAEPGTVVAGETTRRATDQAIVYADAGLHELKGKTEKSRPLAGTARRLRCPRRAKSARTGGAVRRAGPRAAPDQGSVPHVRGREATAADLDHGHRRHRQVAPRLGVLQVLRRPAADHVLASRPLPPTARVTYWALADMVRMRARSPRTGGRERARASLPRSSSSTCPTQRNTSLKRACAPDRAR